MTDSRLTGSDKRALFLWVLCGLIGLVFAQRYFFRAFPEASVDFKVTRSEAQDRARSFVEGLGENLAGYQSTITFSVDDNAKTYLERTLGLQQANRLMASELNIWYWEVRFFKPQQEEEFTVEISPAGKVIAFNHKIEEARAAPSVSREDAQGLAQQFLQQKLGGDLNSWNFLPEEANSKTRPNRTDWTFTWERKAAVAKDAPYRVEVGVQGNKVGGAGEYLRVPEAWSRDYQELRSKNIFYNQVALIPYIFLMGGALWLGVSLALQGKTTWKAALFLGLFVALLYSLMQLNSWDALRASYDTHQSYGSFVAKAIQGILLAALATGAMVTLVLPGGEPLYREAQGERLRLYTAFSARGIRSKEFFCSSVVGLSLAAAHIGFIVAFYMVGSKLGVWAPQDLNYSDVVNTKFPWIAGIAIGVMAATSEEFLFRLFAIPFLRKLTGSRLLAVILPAFFWSFLHSAYPQEPPYIRGIEVGLIGIVAGLVMLRWGIVATLIWHYTVDATLVGMLLIRSDNAYFKISGIVVGLAAVAPLLWSGVTYLARGKFEDSDDLLNSTQPLQITLERQPHAAEESAPARSIRYDALSAGTLGFLALSLVIGGVLAWRLKTPTIGDYLRLSTDNRSVLLLADAEMRQRGFDPSQFHKVAQFVDTTNPITNEFLRRRLSVDQINAIYRDRVPGALWRVRYFRDLQPEEMAVVLKPDGSFHGFHHTLAEAAKGANLSKEDALAIAQKYLAETKHIDLSGWKLVEANSEKLPNRTDHTLTWQRNDPLTPLPAGSAPSSPDAAYERIDLRVLGNEPSGYRTYIKIPEDFVRRQKEQSLPRTLLSIGEVVAGIALFVALLVFFFRGVRQQPASSIPWRRLVLWALAGAGIFVLSFLLGKGIPGILANYQTTMTMKVFFAVATVSVLILSTLVLGGFALLFGLGWSFGARAFGSERMPTWFGMPGDYYRDAFWIALGGTGAFIGLGHLLSVATRWWPTLHREYPASFGSSFDALYPAASIIGNSLVHGLLLTGTFALVGAFLGAELRVRWMRLLLFLAAAVALASEWGNGADFAKQVLASAVTLAFVVYGIRTVARLNVLGCFLVVVAISMLSGALELVTQPDQFYKLQGYAVLGALGVLLVWPLAAWRTSASPKPSAQPT